jgi:flagellar hook-length control protein FliK
VEGLQYATEGQRLVISQTDEASLAAEPIAATQTATPATEATAGYDTQEQADQGAAQAETTDAPLLPRTPSAYAQPSGDIFGNTVTAQLQTTPAIPASLATPNGVNASEVINQIMDRVRIAPPGQFSEIRLTLRPENLGDVTLRVQAQNGIVVAQLIAENQRVKEALEANFNQLRDALEEQGIRFAELSVSVGGDDAEDRMNAFAQGQQRSRGRVDRISQASDNAEKEVMDAAQSAVLPLGQLDVST